MTEGGKNSLNLYPIKKYLKIVKITLETILKNNNSCCYGMVLFWKQEVMIPL